MAVSRFFIIIVTVKEPIWGHPWSHPLSVADRPPAVCTASSNDCTISRTKSSPPNWEGLLCFYHLYLLNLVKSMTIGVMSAMTAKMPSILPARIVRPSRQSYSLPPYFKSCGTRVQIILPAGRLHLPGDVRTHRVHQKMVLPGSASSPSSDDARGHRRPGNACWSCPCPLVTISNAAFKDADATIRKEAVDVANAVGVFIGDEKGNFNAKGSDP